jgi:sugar-specific transcriptional regulator TrmB
MENMPDSNPLVLMGFTEIEVKIYKFLLRQAPATGYVVAKALGKPAANIYNALASLEQKGAVVAEEGKRKLFRPVSPEDLLQQLDRRHLRLRELASNILGELFEESRDDRVYRLRSSDQVLEKSRKMIESARKIILIDAFPESVEILKGMIQPAVKRGVTVAIKTYSPVEIEGAVVVLSSEKDMVLQRWPGSWLNIIVDGSEYLIALLTRNRGDVIQSVWTESPYLAWIHHSAFSAEIILTALQERIGYGASSAELQKTLKEFSVLQMPGAPGYLAIMNEISEQPHE